MKDRKYIKKIKKRIIALTAALIIVCVSFSASYSSFQVNSSNHRAVEMYAQALSYEIRINDIYTDNLSIEPGNKYIDLLITSNNDVATKYKLVVDNDNLDIFYLDNAPSGVIGSNDTISLKLFISNNNNTLEKLTFHVSAGYENNSLDDIDIKDYYEIENKLSIGDYIEYTPNNDVTEYTVLSSFTGLKDQTVIRKTSKYRILNINEDGSLDIISENPLTIDNKNNLLTFSSDIGYNNSVYLLNDICDKLYGSYNAKGRNLTIEDIELKLSDKWNYKTYYNPQTENGYKTYTENTYAPTSLVNNILESEESELLTTNNSQRLDALTIKVNYWTHEMESDNYIDNTYDLFMNKKYSYWLSSRYTNAFDSYALYGLFSINKNVVGGNLLYSSIQNSFTNSNAIRPVITLKNTIYLEKGQLKIK